jgi:hypothetical protein
MPINFQDIGVHKGVYSIVFGAGDVIMTNAKRADGDRMLLFYSAENGKAGEVIEYEQGTTTDDLPFPEAAFIFNHPMDISLLIQMLIEIQKTMLV